MIRAILIRDICTRPSFNFFPGLKPYFRFIPLESLLKRNFCLSTNYLMCLQSNDNFVKGGGGTPQKDDPFEDRIILPDVAIPIHYDLKLEPCLKTFKVNGHVDIQ